MYVSAQNALMETTTIAVSRLMATADRAVTDASALRQA